MEEAKFQVPEGDAAASSAADGAAVSGAPAGDAAAPAPGPGAKKRKSHKALVREQLQARARAPRDPAATCSAGWLRA